MSRFAAALNAAQNCGHVLAHDPPHPIASIDRYTCSRCGCGVLGNGSTAYGSVTEGPCAGIPVETESCVSSWTSASSNDHARVTVVVLVDDVETARASYEVERWAVDYVTDAVMVQAEDPDYESARAERAHDDHEKMTDEDVEAYLDSAERDAMRVRREAEGGSETETLASVVPDLVKVVGELHRRNGDR